MLSCYKSTLLISAIILKTTVDVLIMSNTTGVSIQLSVNTESLQLFSHSKWSIRRCFSRCNSYIYKIARSQTKYQLFNSYLHLKRMQYRGKAQFGEVDTKQEIAPQHEANEDHQRLKHDELVMQETSVVADEQSHEFATISEIIGQFGIYQFSLSMLTFMRFINVAMMTNTGPLIAPDLNYWCALPNATAPLIAKPENSTMEEYLNKKCKVDLVDGKQYVCSRWTYDTSATGATLTDTFNLVCERDYLRDTFQSVISVGVVLGSVVWGSFSDRHGRYMAAKISFLCSLVSGLVSIIAEDFLSFTIARSVCSFGDIGLVTSLATMLLETVGNKYRGAICIIVYTGWSLGVMIMPWVIDFYKDFRLVMLCTVVLHALTLPWILTSDESIRWLLSNARPKEALKELKRVCKWNHLLRFSSKSKITIESEVESKFHVLKLKYLPISNRTELEREKNRTRFGRFGVVLESTVGGLIKINKLFGERRLALATLTLIWTNFNSELFYMLFILINSDIGDSIKLNYAIGGAMELLSTVLCIPMASVLSRKTSLASTLLTISVLCFSLALTNSQISVSVLIMNLNKLAISTLSSFVYVVTSENFPTNLRQTGYGLSGTIGSLGAVIAPMLVSQIHMTRLMLILTILPLTAAIMVSMFLKETKGVELSDDLEEEQDNRGEINS